MSLMMIGIGLWIMVGLVLWLWGWRGKRLDDHPVCGRCGFDLVGMKADMREVSNRAGQRCTECGAALWVDDVRLNGEKPGKAAVRIGNRVRGVKKMVAGTVMLVLGLTPMVLMMSGVDWQSKKPNWLLVWEVEHPDWSSDVPGVIGELETRMMNNKVSAPMMRALGESLLDLAQDEDVVWRDEWGGMLVSLHKSGGLNRQQLRAWLELMVSGWEIELPGDKGVRKLWLNDSNDVLVWFRLRQREDWRGWYVIDQGAFWRSGYQWKENLQELHLDEYLLVKGLGSGSSGSMDSSGGSAVGTNPFWGLGDRMRAIREEAGKDEFDLWMTFEATMFSNTAGMSHTEEVKLHVGRVKLVDVQPMAKVVMDEAKRARIEEVVRPSSQMVFHTRIVHGSSGELFYAPHTLVGEAFEPNRYLPVGYLDDYQNRRNAERHVNFVVVFEGVDKKHKWWRPQLEYATGYDFVEGPMCNEMVLVVDGEEYPQGVYLSAKGGDGHKRRSWMGYGMMLPDGVGVGELKCDVILRPAPAYAYNHEHMEKILGEEIVYKEVNLLRVPIDEVEQARAEFDAFNKANPGSPRTTEGWIDLRQRAKEHLVAVGEFESLEAIEAYIAKVKGEKQ
ncbi:hypothetical protein [Poriferisphaera sp. WC338]|uniref:hypothetical protein n=1 Tax=Poriferisphaera sp. WC338 TaxID=3425129 RepID=UPI003D812895